MSDDRPTCRHFGRCGGCTGLDVPIDVQLARKRERAARVLAPFLGDVALALDPPPRPPRLDRMKLLYPAQPGPGGELVAGLYARGSHELVEIEECQVQARALTLLAQRVAAILRAHGSVPYDESTGAGWLRALHARIAPGTGELLVGLVTAHATPPAPRTVAAVVEACHGLPRATRASVHLVGLVQNVNPRPGNALLGDALVTLHGRDHQFDRADGLTFRVGFLSFYQVHRHAAALLFRPALAMLGDVRGLRAIDGYGGVGSFALRLAAAGARRVDLVEASASACADARASAETNALAERVAVHQGPFAAVDLPGGADVVVVDPPRAGLGSEGVARVLRHDAPRVLYVSCSVDSLARDLAGLAERYRVRAARLCDLFPHTEHVETVLLLERAG